MKIEIRKPQYLAAKESVAEVKKEAAGEKTPFFFRLLLAATYILSGLAIWYVYQKYSMHP
jgi:cytochrome b subunit of formate dehydrogenase